MILQDFAAKHLFYSEFAKLINAGFDIRKAVEILSQTHLPRRQKGILGGIRKRLGEGRSIAASFKLDPKLVGELELELISAGERGGVLGTAMQHLAEYFGMLAWARREVMKGLVYQFIVLHLAVFVFVVPMRSISHQKSFGALLVDFIWVLAGLYVVCALGATGCMFFWRKADKVAWMDYLIRRIPWVGKARRMFALSRFCRVYHSSLLAGLPMREVVRVATNAAQSGKLLEAGRRIEEVTKSGQPLGPQFVKEKVFPKAFSQSYYTGEEAGTLDRDLESWARRYQEAAEGAVRSASVYVPKVIYCGMLLLVAWQIISFFSGYYSFLDSIGEP